MTSQDYMAGKIIPTEWTFDNYSTAFQRLPLVGYLLNSLIVSTLIVIGQLLFSSLAAYAFVFIEFKGRDAIFYLFIATMMIPFEASIIPNFQTIKAWGLIDSYSGLALPFLATAFGTFYYVKRLNKFQKNYGKLVKLLVSGHFVFIGKLFYQ